MARAENGGFRRLLNGSYALEGREADSLHNTQEILDVACDEAATVVAA
jgi:hypothetical protein